MVREISAGGVVVRCLAGAWNFAAILPRREPASDTLARRRKSPSTVLALPKGLVDPGEKPDQTALREVHEETGVTASLFTFVHGAIASVSSKSLASTCCGMNRGGLTISLGRCELR